jgi:RNA polymerase sigma-70 factor (ECF subfamily)
MPELPEGHNEDLHEHGAAALGELVRVHSSWLRTVIFARVRNWHAVEEVLQELGLALTRLGVPPGEDCRPWLRQVAIRQALLYRRRNGRLRRREETAAEIHRQESGNGRLQSPDPLEWLVARERAEMIRAAIGELPPVEAELLMLKYGEGWSYEQIAQHLGTTSAAVQSRLHRARAHLRQKLASLLKEGSERKPPP